MESETANETYEVCDDFCAYCQGAPRCPYENKEVQKAIAEGGGCMWCEKQWFDSEGNVSFEMKPGEA